MINPKDHIRYMNVVSRKYRSHYQDFDAALKDFMEELISINVTLKGPLFYSINNVPMEELVNFE